MPASLSENLILNRGPWNFKTQLNRVWGGSVPSYNLGSLQSPIDPTLQRLDLLS